MRRSLQVRPVTTTEDDRHLPSIDDETRPQPSAISLKERLKAKYLTQLDLDIVLKNIINRTRFYYTWFDALEYLVRCLCIRKVRFSKAKMTKEEWSETVRKHYLFQKGSIKLAKELDVIAILKALRRVKLLTQTLITQRQKMLLRFQRQNIIESSPSSGDSESDHKLDPVNMLESKNPLVRLVILVKLKKMTQSYLKAELDQTDRRLINGLFYRRLKDFDESMQLKMSKTLYERFKSIGTFSLQNQSRHVKKSLRIA